MCERPDVRRWTMHDKLSLWPQQLHWAVRQLPARQLELRLMRTPVLAAVRLVWQANARPTALMASTTAPVSVSTSCLTIRTAAPAHTNV